MVDHAANAQGAGLTLGRTTVVTFGGAKAGTPLMQAHQTLGRRRLLRVQHCVQRSTARAV
jgi:uncharacterized protein (DUF302 family)